MDGRAKVRLVILGIRHELRSRREDGKAYFGNIKSSLSSIEFSSMSSLNPPKTKLSRVFETIANVHLQRRAHQKLTQFYGRVGQT